MSDEKGLSDRLHELGRRCARVGLVVREHIERATVDGDPFAQHCGWFVGSVPADFPGAAHLLEEPDIAFALKTEFERYHPIDGYEAMWSEDGILEAEIVTREPSNRQEHGFTTLLRRLNLPQRGVDPRQVVIEFPDSGTQPRISLRFASPELLVWRTASPAIHLIHPEDLVPCIRIEGPPIPNGTAATDRLVTMGNAALMELDQGTGFAARLRTHYPWGVWFTSPSRPYSLAYPDRTPHRVPFDLYMYARLDHANLSASFLGYYQVLEYFFPRLSTEQEVSRLRARLNSESPSLASVSDDDLALVLEHTKLNRGGRGVGSEREQLRDALESVISAGELREFIERDRGLLKFYRRLTPPIVEQRVRVESSNRDLRSDLAARIYAIRCRIVHRKESADEDVFIPFAAEVAELTPDVRVMRFLARRALTYTAERG